MMGCVEGVATWNDALNLLCDWCVSGAKAWHRATGPVDAENQLAASLFSIEIVREHRRSHPMREATINFTSDSA